MALIFSDEDIENIKDLAAVNYSPEKIALYLQVDKKEFMAIWYDHESEVRQAYDIGLLTSEFLINQEQLKLAKKGNITAAQIFLKEAERIKTENIVKRILFGDETD